ncbi:hypothetical protein [Roseibium album]|uniref:hypothetical protein n=1 Tax=Roseibium album TaxID=311410 RepID=UPI003299F13B
MLSIIYIRERPIFERICISIKEVVSFVIFVCCVWAACVLILVSVTIYLPDFAILSLYDLGLAGDKPENLTTEKSTGNVWQIQIALALLVLLMAAHLFMNEIAKRSSKVNAVQFLFNILLLFAMAIFGLFSLFIESLGLIVAFLALVMTPASVTSFLSSISEYLQFLKYLELPLTPTNRVILGFAVTIFPYALLIYTLASSIALLVHYIDAKFSRFYNIQAVETLPSITRRSNGFSFLGIAIGLDKNRARHLLSSLLILLIYIVSAANIYVLLFVASFYIALWQTLDYYLEVFFPRIAFFEGDTADGDNLELFATLLAAFSGICIFVILLFLFWLLLNVVRNKIFKNSAFLSEKPDVSLLGIASGLLLFICILPSMIWFGAIFLYSFTPQQISFLSNHIFTGGFASIIFLGGFVISAWILFCYPVYYLARRSYNYYFAIYERQRKLIRTSLSQSAEKSALFLRNFDTDTKFYFKESTGWFQKILQNNSAQLRFEALVAGSAYGRFSLVAYSNPYFEDKNTDIARTTLGDDEWKKQFLSDLIISSATFVIFGKSNSLDWELEQISSPAFNGTVLLVIPPDLKEPELVLSYLSSKFSKHIPAMFDCKILEKTRLITVDFAKPHSKFFVTSKATEDSYYSCLEHALRDIRSGQW